jgi:tetratricopeptide (TPR) repeat protein
MKKVDQTTATTNEVDLLELSNAYLDLGQLLEKSGKVREAKIAYQKALDADPSSSKALLLMGNSLRYNGEFLKADVALKKALRLTGENDKEGRATVLFGLALSVYDQERYSDAIEHVTEALSLSPSAPLYTLLGKSLYFLDRDEEALVAFEKAVELEPTSVDAWIGKAEALEALDHVEEALTTIDYALILAPENDIALTDRARLLSQLEQFDEALPAFDKAIEKNPSDTTAWIDKVDVLRWLGRTEEALDTVNRALANFPDEAQLLITKGQILTDLRQPEASIEVFDQAAQDQTWAPLALDNKANALLSLKRYEEALSLFEDAEKLNLDPAWAATHKGHLLRYLEEFPAALAEYDRALKLQPNSSWILAGKAEALYRMRKFDETIQYWNQVIELLPESPEAYGRRAEAYRFIGNSQKGRGDQEYIASYHKALEDLDYALKINPKIDWFLFQRYAVKQTINPDDNSRADLEAAIKYGRELTKTTGNWMHICNLALYHLAMGELTEAKRLYDEAILGGASIFTLNEALKDLEENSSLVGDNMQPMHELLDDNIRRSPEYPTPINRESMKPL